MMFLQKLHVDSISKEIKEIGSDEVGIAIMSKKADFFAFKITDISFNAAMILKQEALSLGAEFATPKECILGKKEKYDGVLFGTLAQLIKLVKKCKIQPFGLKNLANALQKHLDCQRSFDKRQIMAVVNVTPDSFYENSRQTQVGAIDRIETLLQSEVSIIDIGGASSRPGSELSDPQIEIKRLKEVFNYIREARLGDKKCFSIDTYHPEVARLALKSGFRMINDVSGFANEKMFEVAQEFDAKVVLMHTRGTPDVMMNMNNYENLFKQVDDFFNQQLEKCESYGLRDIVLDIGFGFAKDIKQNFLLIKHLEHFCHFGLPLLVGASRKSSLQKVVGCRAEDALSATLAMHLLALQNGAQILRVHDEKEHLDILKILEVYYGL